MPSYFFDSSAIVKRYRREPGSAWVHAVCDPHKRPPIYLSELARVEVTAALRRTGRLDGLHPSFVDATIAEFERHLILSAISRRDPMYRLVPVSSVVVELAAMLCNRHWGATPGSSNPLRSLDAIQLAAAILTANALTDALLFVTADQRLSAVATLEGFSVVNPLAPPAR